MLKTFFKAWFIILLVFSAVGSERLQQPAKSLYFEQRTNGFYSRGQGCGYYFEPSSVTVLADASVNLTFPGAAKVKPRGLGRTGARVHLFTGSDPSRWQTGLEVYSRVEYPQLYDGIDLVFYGNERRLEYDFLVAPGVDPRQIAIKFDGDVDVSVGGNLHIETPEGVLLQHPAYAYQEVDGKRKEVVCSYEKRADGSVGFALGAYDPSRVLVIDPELEYSTYLGGSGTDGALSVDVDSEGNTYVTGRTTSSDFPTARALQAQKQQLSDVFVSKFDPEGRLLFSTYLGGESDESSFGLRVDRERSIIVTGTTFSQRFPLVEPQQERNKGGFDVFVTKLSNDGDRILYSTYYGGSSDDRALGLDIDPAGNIYVSGDTNSRDFPIVRAFQSTFGGGTQASDTLGDAFLFKLTRQGSIDYSTYLGGSSNERARAVSVDNEGNVAIAGLTFSSNLPVLNATSASLGGARDGFLATFDPEGRLQYCTYIGGTGLESAEGVVHSQDGRIYVSGFTSSTDFPITHTVVAAGGGGDTYVQAYSRSGARLYSTTIGGTGSDIPRDIAFHNDGGLLIAGTTSSDDLPLYDPFQDVRKGGFDGYLLKLSLDGTRIEFASYFGGAGYDDLIHLAVGGDGLVSVAGTTQSADFPTVNAFQSTYGGREAGSADFTGDAVVLKLAIPNRPPDVEVTVPAEGAKVTAGLQTVISFMATDGGQPLSAITVSLSTDDGQTFPTLIGTFSGETRSVAWSVPSGLATDQARVKVDATDGSGTTGSGLSERFQIVPVETGQPLLKVRIDYQPPPPGQVLPPQNVRLKATILGDKAMPPAASQNLQAVVRTSPTPQQGSTDVVAYKVYRLPIPDGSDRLPSAEEIVQDANLVATLPGSITSFEEFLQPTGNFAYSLTSTFGSGQQSGGSNPAGTNVPLIRNPVFEKGTIFFDLAGSFIATAGARLVVNSTESYTIVVDSSGLKYTVSKKELSTPGGLKIKKVIRKGRAVTLMVINPDSTRSLTTDFTRR